MAKILIVDDEAVFIKMTRTLLEDSGYEVITAGDGQEGLEKTRSENPDLIILDIMMPKMDGYTMLEKVRKDEKIKDTPVIQCSGKTMKDYLEETQDVEIDAYFTKPFVAPILLAKIESLLKK